ncbi:MAG: 2-isopropylmalate synthase [Planctomycetota bacterium]|jgi:2-isopropylmalate synthase|nr:2-isopropylmalate synthase [Planctomycetota bacterium]
MTTDSNRVIIFDTTLRDGEQSPGASMNLAEKLEVARALERLGVDVIEAGFPIASPGDFEAVQAIAKQTTRARIAGLARSLTKDIDRAAEAVAPAGDRARIHVFLATSAIHRQYKLGKAKDQIIKQAAESVRYARTLCDDIEFSPEDASRTEPEFLAEVVQAVIEAGAKTVNIPDTVGYAYPSDFADLIGYLNQHVTNIKQAVISVHCHNDLGLAVSNSLSAVRAGARQIECTINGIGERAGNCALEEVVMAMRVRKDQFGDMQTGIQAEHLYATSRLVQSVTGLPLQRNKAIVGDNAFAHESGIHQHGVIKNPECYEIMTPQSVGVPATNMVLGKHSGRHALAQRLEELGFTMSEDDLQKVFDAFKDLADRKKDVYDGDLMALVEQEVRGRSLSIWSLDFLQTSSGSHAVATATVTLSKDGEAVTDAATGDGPVDAVINTIDRICGVAGTLEDYRLRSVTGGRDAQGEVSIRVRFANDNVVGGKGLSTDVVEASCKAYLDAVNRASYMNAKLDYRSPEGTQP